MQRFLVCCCDVSSQCSLLPSFVFLHEKLNSKLPFITHHTITHVMCTHTHTNLRIRKSVFHHPWWLQLIHSCYQMTKNLMTGVGGQWGHSKITFWSVFCPWIILLYTYIICYLVGFVLIPQLVYAVANTQKLLNCVRLKSITYQWFYT